MEVQSQFNLSKDTVVPSALWLDPNIEPAAVKLYAIIRGLSDKYGYCYASNEYLAESINYRPTQLKKFLTDLKKHGYIEVETNRQGVKWDRRVYISDKFNKILRRSVERPCKVGGATYNKKNNKKEEYKDYVPFAEASGLAVSFLNAIKKIKPDFKPPNLEKWTKEIDKMLKIDNRSPESIKKIIDWLPTNGFWSKNVLSAEKLRHQFDRLELEKMSEKQGEPSSIAENKSFSSHVSEKYPQLVKKGHIEIKKESIVFIYGSIYEEIFFSENGFKDRVISRLKKMNLNTEGL